MAGRDDDETTNVALREKLRRHGLEIPEYDAEAGVEAYLTSVAEAVRNRPRWRVRRWMTIGMFLIRATGDVERSRSAALARRGAA